MSSGPSCARGVVVALLAMLLLLPVTPSAHADPTPQPPPPGGTAAGAARVGELVGRVAALRARLDDLQDELGDRQELANRALADDTAARSRAATAAREADGARAVADAAAARAEDARRRVDAWVTAWFQQADVTGVGSMLAGTTTPDDVLERARMRDVVTDEQLADLDAFDRERVVAANADSSARAARASADQAAAGAAAARRGAAAALERTRGVTDGVLATLRTTSAERDAAQNELRAMEAADAALAAQRRRAEEFETRSATQASAADTAEGAAARARLAAPDAARNPVRVVLDRALSTLGTVYAWGGGDAAGPTRGIRDGGVADAFGDFDKVGFDCSGLMIYAFAGVGRELPHYSGYQATAGPQVPLAQRRPGDMLFWADGDGVHHVALYLGNDRMIEAPQSGKVVRVTDVRFDDEIVPTVTRLL